MVGVITSERGCPYCSGRDDGCGRRFSGLYSKSLKEVLTGCGSWNAAGMA